MIKRLLVRDNIFLEIGRNGRKYVKSDKFFWEHPIRKHLDLQYGKKKLNKNDIHKELKFLLKESTQLFEKNNIKAIIMHGSLIGWYFNKKILNWDDDIDISIADEKSIKNLLKLDRYQTKDFIIKINPNYKNRNINDRRNVIDARIISKRNGVFIDITFLSQLNNYIINCKSPHYYKKTNIFPLKKDIFENCNVYIPNNFKSCLIQEYGSNVFNKRYENWIFKNNDWIKI